MPSFYSRTVVLISFLALVGCATPRKQVPYAGTSLRANTESTFSPLELDEPIGMPKIVSSPLYPDAFKGERTGGFAEVDYIIGKTGSVTDVVCTSASDKEFAESAVACVKQWVFNPPLRRGKAVSVLIHQRFDFSWQER